MKIHDARSTRPAALAMELLSMALLPWIAGCSGGALRDVTGAVTYRNVPVADGQIVFASIDGQGASAAAPVIDGQYQVVLSPGEKLVRITASQEADKIVEGAMGDTYRERIDLIPPQYNSESTLKRRIEDEPGQVLDFALE